MVRNERACSIKGVEATDFVTLIDTGPPGQVKAISGPKSKPTEQGPLTGALKEIGFDESQVGCALDDVVIVADPMRTGVQILDG